MAMRNAFENMALDSSVKAIGTNPAAPLYIAPGSAGAVGQSRFRLASSGRVSLNLAGNLRALVINPANDDGGTPINRSVQIVRLAVFASAMGWAQLYINPTTGLPAISTRRPKMNALVLSTATAPIAPSASDPIDLRIDVNTTVALAGGVDTGVTFGIPGGQRTTLDLPPLVLTPGQSLGINVPFAGAADVSMSCYWVVVQVHDPVCPSDNCSRRKPSVPESDTVNDSGERVMVLTLTGEIEYWHPDCYELRPN